MGGYSALSREQVVSAARGGGSGMEPADMEVVVDRRGEQDGDDTRLSCRG
jgi:hypothetical protein